MADPRDPLRADQRHLAGDRLDLAGGDRGGGGPRSLAGIVRRRRQRRAQPDRRSAGVAWVRADDGELRTEPLPAIARRTGYDLRPVDVSDEAQAGWLRACVWPGQHTRAEGLESGIAAFCDAAGTPEAPRVEVLDAADVPARLPVSGPEGPRAIVYGTIMRDYLPDEVRERYRAGMRDWLRACAAGTAIWSELEITTEERTEGPPVDLIVHVEGDGGLESLLLARCEPHPRSIEVCDEAVERLRAALR